MADIIHIAFIIKPEKFWQKHRTSMGTSKLKFEVRFPDLSNSLSV